MIKYLKSFFINPSVKVEKKQERKEALSKRAKKYNSISFIREMDDVLNLKNFENAVNTAVNPPLYSRKSLLEIYEHIAVDDDVFAEMETRKLKTLSEDFVILDKNGKENKDLKKICEESWFYQAQSDILESVFYGFTVLEITVEKNLINVESLDRLYFNPALEIFLPNPYTENAGYDYLSHPNIIQIGKKTDLGLFRVLAKLVIRKNYSYRDWSRMSEKFGLPLITLMLDTSDPKEVEKMVDGFENLGSAGVASLHRDDEIKYLETARTDPYKIYLEAINLLSQKISKVITGQVDATNSVESGSYARAEVHEKMLQDRMWSDIRLLQNAVNNQLFPKLTQLGLTQFENAKYFSKNWLDSPLAKKESEQSSSEKKKTMISKSIGNIENQFWQIVLAWITAFYKGENTKEIESSLTKKTAQELLESVESGFLDSLIPDLEFRNVVENILDFSQRKTNSMTLEMGKALFDHHDKKISFEDFEDFARNINKKYNLNYLRSEKNHAFSSANARSKWLKYEKDKDDYDLKYVAVLDDRTRKSHRALHGIVAPFEDNIWNKIFVPNDVGCRCDIIQVVKGTKGKPIPDNIEVKIDNNVAKTGQFFPENFYKK